MPTYKLIESANVGSGGTSYIEFALIPATYTDLLVKYSIRSARPSVNGDGVWVALNTSTSTFTGYQFYGAGTSTGAITTQPRNVGVNPAEATTASVFSNGEFYIPNYRGATHKSLLSRSTTENNGSEAFGLFGVNVWETTDAITNIRLYAEFAHNLVQYSTAYLYGISNT